MTSMRSDSLTTFQLQSPIEYKKKKKKKKKKNNQWNVS